MEVHSNGPVLDDILLSDMEVILENSVCLPTYVLMESRLCDCMQYKI